MKICDLTQSYAETGGGVRTHLHAKHDYLMAHTDHEYVRIVPGPRDEVHRDGRATIYRVASPPVPGVPAYRLLLRSDKVLRILEEERPDIIEVHCTYNLPWTALWHRRKHDAAVVGFCMTDLGSAYVEPGVAKALGPRAGRAARAATDRYTRALYSRCDATVAISAAMADDLQDRGVEGATWVPLGVDLERFRPRDRPDDRPADVRERFGADPDDLLLVYAGRLDSEKRPDVVVDAFERLPADFPAVLVLAGEGPLRQPLADRTADDPRVHVLPFIQDRDELAELLGSADLYVSGMPHETFGLSVVEAQACALPVVGVRSGAMVERVTEGGGEVGGEGGGEHGGERGGERGRDTADGAEGSAGGQSLATDPAAAPENGILVPAGDGAAMARAIRELEADRPRLRAMGQAGRRHVEERFSWRRTFEDLLELYGQLLEGRDAE